MKTSQLQGFGKQRCSNDFYPTPETATLKLFKKELFAGNVWEPACGDGAISKLVESELGLECFSTDLNDHGYGTPGQDFLSCNLPAGRIDNIITNPPFVLAEDFILRALLVAERKVAMLVKLNFLAGQNRYNKIFATHPPSRVYVFSKRLNFDRGEDKAKTTGGLLEYAWFVWIKRYPAKTELCWL